MSGTFITINQYTTGGFATGHVDFTIHYSNGSTATYGKNWNGDMAHPQGGWYREDQYLTSPPPGVTLVHSSGAISVPDENVAAMQTWLNQQVNGGASAEPYAIALMNCVDGINEVLGKFVDSSLDVLQYLINNGTLVYNYAVVAHSGAANLDNNGRVIITTPMYFVNPDLDMPSGWEPTPNPTKVPHVIIEPVDGLNGLYIGTNSLTIDGSHTTDTNDPNWDGWWVYSGQSVPGTPSGPVNPDVDSIT